MWFKNIQIFNLTEPFNLTAEQLEDYLVNDAARPCGQLEMSTYGWTPPLGLPHEALTHQANACIMLAAKHQDKLLPTTVVREQVAEKIAAIEQEQGRKVSARERRGMVDEMTIKLMPQALVKSSIIYGYIDLNNQWIVVNTSSRPKAEEFTILLRKSLGSLKVAPPSLKRSVPQVVTEWLVHDDYPSDISIDDQCELRDPDHEKNIIRVLNQSLHGKEVINHITAGKQVIKVAMTWADRVSFMLDQDFAIKRIKFLDLVQEQSDDTYTETPEERFDADFAIFSAEFSALLPRLYELFGGSSEAAPTDAETAAVEAVEPAIAD